MNRFRSDAALARDARRLTGRKDLAEFGRVVHAEMEALLACARMGVSTKGATLYTTTFPCHNCAKHIVAAGIVKVVYIEPYPKSRALELHDDSVSMNPKRKGASCLCRSWACLRRAAPRALTTILDTRAAGRSRTLLE